MRALIFLAALVVLGLGISETADAESWNRCKTMTRQVEHFYGIVDLAKARENVLWEQATRKHIADLEDKRLKQCPRYIERSKQIAAMVRHKKNVEEMKKLMKIAADLAIKYYTGGFY
jgi:hypothetical protein